MTPFTVWNFCVILSELQDTVHSHSGCATPSRTVRLMYTVLLHVHSQMCCGHRKILWRHCEYDYFDAYEVFRYLVC